MHKLPADTAKLIASSQVITGVLSVVKELVENSLDAGATNIEVRLENYGLDKVEVRDNGSGIESKDVEVAAQRSYTSKISSHDDLLSLTTYGFRGEALSSLCEVSKVTLITRTCDQSYSTQYSLDSGGEITATQPSHLGQGTSIIAHNLFYNLPVRKQYFNNVKRRKEQLKLVEDVLMAFGIIQYDLRITLWHNKSVIWRKAKTNSLQSSVLNVLGSNVFSKLTHIQHEDKNGIKLIGYLPIGTNSLISENETIAVFRKTCDRSFLYVNKRPIRDKEIDKIIKKTLSSTQNEVRTSKKWPVMVLNIEIPSSAVDANVEADKSKVVTPLLRDIVSTIEEVINIEKRKKVPTTLPKEKGVSNSQPVLKDEMPKKSAEKTTPTETSNTGNLSVSDLNLSQIDVSFTQDANFSLLQNEENDERQKDIFENINQNDTYNQYVNHNFSLSEQLPNHESTRIVAESIEHNHDTNKNFVESPIKQSKDPPQNIDKPTIHNQKLTKLNNDSKTIHHKVEENNDESSKFCDDELWSRGRILPSQDCVQPVRILNNNGSNNNPISSKPQNDTNNNKRERSKEKDLHTSLSVDSPAVKKSRTERTSETDDSFNTMFSMDENDFEHNKENRTPSTKTTKITEMFQFKPQKAMRETTKPKSSRKHSLERMKTLSQKSFLTNWVTSSQKHEEEQANEFNNNSDKVLKKIDFTIHKLRSRIDQISKIQPDRKNLICHIGNVTLGDNQSSLILLKGNIVLANNQRTMETILYQRLLENHIFHADKLDTPIRIAINKLNHEEIEGLEYLDQIEHRNYGDSEIIFQSEYLQKNGLEISQYQDADTGEEMLNIKCMPTTVDLFDLSDVRELLSNLPKGGIAETRPEICQLHLKREAVRISSSTPANNIAESLQNLLNMSQTLSVSNELNLTCLHKKPLFCKIHYFE